METQSILYRTLWLFGATFLAVAVAFVLVIWWVLKRGGTPPSVGRRRNPDSVRALQRRLDVRADVLGADVLVELGLVHQAARLWRRAAQDQFRPAAWSRSARSSSARRPVASIAVMLRSRTITIGARLVDVIDDARELVRRAEQNGPWMRKTLT